MTRIDFYIVAGDSARHSEVVCSLSHKASRGGQRVYVYTPDEASAASLDQRLWTWRDTSFLPHARFGEPEAEHAPVVLGHVDPGAWAGDVLINLHPEVPGFFARFNRVLEVVDADPENRRRGRVRYRHYQERGYALEVHDLGAAGA